MNTHKLTINKNYICTKRNGETEEHVNSLLREHVLRIVINDEEVIDTICTPEFLEEFVLGHLFTEGMILSADDIIGLEFDKDESIAKVKLEKRTLDRIKNILPISLSDEQVFQMADQMAEGMPLHDKTWGTHSCFLFQNGELLFACEDIGRHNAIDKVIGYALMNQIVLPRCALYTSGRAPSDLVEKVIRAGIPVMASKGVPTQEAVEMAEQYKLTLICSARGDQMKIYTDFRKKGIDALILAGGKSSRMGGKHKGNLKIGEETFVQHLINEMTKVADRVWISYGTDVHEVYADCGIVKDIYKECGPMGGIHAGFVESGAEQLFVVACDMPFMKAEFVEELRKHSSDAYDIILPMSDDRMQPLAAIYKKAALPILEKQLEEGNYRLRSLFQELKTSFVEIKEERWKRMLQNINTVEEYKEIQ